MRSLPVRLTIDSASRSVNRAWSKLDSSKDVSDLYLLYQRKLKVATPFKEGVINHAILYFQESRNLSMSVYRHKQSATAHWRCALGMTKVNQSETQHATACASSCGPSLKWLGSGHAAKGADSAVVLLRTSSRQMGIRMKARAFFFRCTTGRAMPRSRPMKAARRSHRRHQEWRTSAPKGDPSPPCRVLRLIMARARRARHS